MTWVTLRVTLAVWILSNSHTSENIARIDQDIFTHETDMACNFNCDVKTEKLVKITDRGAIRQRLSNDDCPEDEREDYQNYSCWIMYENYCAQW